MSLVLQSSGGGSVTLEEPVTASNLTITVPAVTGTMATIGPAFSAISTVTQSLPSATFTKLAFQTEEFDTANCYDNVTNYRFTPNVAGYYQFVGCMNINLTGITLISFYKNGSEFKRGSQVYTNASTVQPNSTALIYLNGSTDYVECYGYQGSAGSVSTSANSVQVYFQASMVRAA